MSKDTELDIAREVAWAKIGLIADGEILGIDRDGVVVFWSDERQQSYTTGACPDDLDPAKLGMFELERLERDGWHRVEAPATSPV